MIGMQRIVILFIAWMVIACSGETGNTPRLLGIAEGCDAATTSCRIDSGDISVTLGLGPGVGPLKPFPLSLQIAGGNNTAQNVVADFQMQGMDMGANRYRLEPQEGEWQATVTLPVCTASRMDWHAIIEFTLDGRLLRAVFPFHTETN